MLIPFARLLYFSSAL